MEASQEHSLVYVQETKAQPKKEIEFPKAESYQADTCLFCRNCHLLTFSQDHLSTHNCIQIDEKFSCPGYEFCNMANFTSKSSLKSHLQIDHNVKEEELDRFLNTMPTSEQQSQKIQIIDYQLLKKSDDPQNKPKSKIFIKDVTLLRNPDLPNDVNLPNIFDSLDLTTTDDDIFDDFLATDEPEDFDFDFEEPNIDDEIIATSEILNNSLTGKIFVRKNLCDDSSKTEVTNTDVKSPKNYENSSKIYVRSHESLTSQIITDAQQPSESSTPDCVIVSSEIISTENPPQNKIFIRDIETLTNPQTAQETINKTYFDENPASTSANFLTSTSNYANAFTPSIYVRSYDSLVDQPSEETSTDSSQPRCKISIKNMNTLIEPTLMNPPPLGIFGQAQNLVIHMRPNTTDDSLINFRDTSMTPDTLPGSSNVSTCGGTDDVIILDDSELNESFTADLQTSLENINGQELEKLQNEILDDVLENPERNQTPNDKPKIDITSTEIDITSKSGEDQPMTRIPMDIAGIDETGRIQMDLANGNEPTRLQMSLESISDTCRVPIGFGTTGNEATAKLQIENETSRLPMGLGSTVNEPTMIPLSLPPVKDSTRLPIPDEPPNKKMKIVKIIRVKKNSSTEDSNTINPLDGVQVVFKCNHGECTQHFSNATLLNYHKRCHTTANQICCPECNSQTFRNFNTLHTHLWRNHSVNMDLFACKLCNFKTPILSRLKNFHQKIHSNEKNYKCEHAGCGKKFKNSKQLKNHAQIHKVSNSNGGSQQTSDSDSLKKIRCQICNKGFSSESGLYIHFMEHKNDEKRFICEERGCDYSTNDHNSFRRHKFQHSKTHQYTCPACDYKSIQSNTYRKHLEKQHKELAESLLFKCGSCKFVTISKRKYDGHVAKHYSDG